ncbi:MAG TPA: DUF177 domain-containing protein [Geobacteraceae bacterium]
MKIHVTDIKEKPLQRVTEEAVEEFPSLVEMKEAAECDFLAPVRLEVTITREYDHIRVQGQVGTAVRLSCSRCLADYETDISSAFTIFYTPTSGELLDEEIELTEEDLVSAGYEGDEIDLAPVVAEQIIMAIPLKPLCKEECLGLCSNCGADLNVAPCECERAAVNLKFSALQNLKIEK